MKKLPLWFFAPLFSAVCTIGAVVHAAEPIKISESYDQYTKVGTLTTDKFNVPDVGSFFDPGFAYAWLTAHLDQGFAPAIGLNVYFQRANGWRFFDRAFDSDGNSIKVVVLSRDVQYGSTVVEQFSAHLSLTYLQTHRDKGLDIRFDGKGGSLVVKLPKDYVQAMLDKLGSSANTTAQGTPEAEQKPVRKLRLGIRYLDEVMAQKLPETVRANLPSNGLLLVAVESGSPAAAAGLAIGDVLTEFAGTKISTPKDMASVMEKIKSGETVEATVIRNGQTIQLPVAIK